MSSSALPDAWLELPDHGTHWLKGRCTIGRAPDNDLVLRGKGISSHHALLLPSKSGFTLTDLHSRCGTFLRRSNGAKVDDAQIGEATELHDADQLLIGEVTLCYRCNRTSGPSESTGRSTVPFDRVRTRTCWLLVADIEGYTSLSDRIGSAAALPKLRAWIADMRPLLEKHGAKINGYLGDAILAYWVCDFSAPDQLLGVGQALQEYQARSELPFRFVVHHGDVLFTSGGKGEELGGQEVNFIFRAEKIAKQLGTKAILSTAAAASLRIAERCVPAGKSTAKGISGEHEFFVWPEARG